MQSRMSKKHFEIDITTVDPEYLNQFHKMTAEEILNTFCIPGILLEKQPSSFAEEDHNAKRPERNGERE